MGRSFVTTGRMVMMRSIGYKWDEIKNKKKLPIAFVTGHSLQRGSERAHISQPEMIISLSPFAPWNLVSVHTCTRCEEVLYLQPLIPPKRFDIFFPPLTGGCSEGLGAFWFFVKHTKTLLCCLSHLVFWLPTQKNTLHGGQSRFIEYSTIRKSTVQYTSAFRFFFKHKIILSSNNPVIRAERRNKGRNISCQNGSPHKKPRLDVLVRSPLLTSHKWRELVPSGRLVCTCHDVFLWCYVCFVLLRFRLYAFVEAAAPRSIVLRYESASIATRDSFSFLEMSLFQSFFLCHFRFLFVWRVLLPSYVLSFEWCFSTLWPRAGLMTSAYVRIQPIKQYEGIV